MVVHDSKRHKAQTLQMNAITKLVCSELVCFL